MLVFLTLLDINSSINKSLKISLYYMILIFNLTLDLRVISNKEIMLDTKKVTK